jgi:hypothetical protein
MDQAQYEWPLWTREFWDRFIVCARDLAPQVKLKLEVGYGVVEQEIARCANLLDCDLVIMAVSATARIASSLLKVLRCPLLLTHAHQETDMESCLRCDAA